jgi:hypothetical protein
MEAEDVATGRVSLYKTLRSRAASLVRQEFGLIDGLAGDHVADLRPNRDGWSWGIQKNDVDILPRIVTRFQGRS